MSHMLCLTGGIDSDNGIDNESIAMKQAPQDAEVQGQKTRSGGVREVSQAKAQGMLPCRWRLHFHAQLQFHVIC
jgi:hypothetical protein